MRSLLCLLVTMAGCSEDDAARETEPPPGEEEPADPPRGPGEDAAGGIVVDTSATSRFVVGMPETATIVGRVTAPRGLASLTVDGAAVGPSAGGDFSATVPIEPGLRLVEVTATDGGSPSASRDGHLALLVAGYRPEGQVNPAAVSVSVTEELLAAIAEPARAALAEADIAGELMRAGTFSQEGCEMTITGASNGPPDVELALRPDGQLGVVVTIPALHIDFVGSCTLLIATADVTGTIDTDVVVRTAVSAPAGETCVERFEHSAPEVELVGFDLALHGSGLLGLLVPIFGDMAEGEVAADVETQVTEQADALLAEQLASLSVFDVNETVDLMGASADVALCLTGLVADPAGPRAIFGASVTSAGAGEAPGAPYLPSALPPAEPGVMLLDAGFIGQLMFAAYGSGLLEQQDAAEVDIGLLSLLAPEIEELHPGAETASVSIEGRLPPLVTAAPAEEGDLLVELGELDVVLSVGGDELFRVGTLLRIVLDLVPEGASLRPEVGPVTATAFVLDEGPVDIDDDALAEAIRLQIPSMAAELLGAEAIALPAADLGASLAVADVSPVPGSSYLRIAFE